MGLTKKKKEQIVNAIYQAFEEVAESFGLDIDTVVDVFAEHVGLEEEESKPKAKPKARKAEKAKKTEEAPEFEKGQTVKVKVDGKWIKGEVKRVLKTKVRVKTKDGVVSAPFEDVKPLK